MSQEPNINKNEERIFRNLSNDSLENAHKDKRNIWIIITNNSPFKYYGRMRTHNQLMFALKIHKMQRL